jgi:hypothetical protein
MYISCFPFQLIVKVIESERISTLIWDKSNYAAFIPEASSDFAHVDTLKINQTTSNWSDSRGPGESQGTIWYGFHNAQDSRSLGIFVIDTLSGEVRLAKAGLIDRETLAQHILTVKARDPFNFYAFVRLTVYIEEFNDHPPMFYSADGRYPRTEVRIPETTAVGSLIAQVSSRMKMIA